MVILLIPGSLHCWETCMKRLTKTSPAPRITTTARKWMPCRTASASCANLELCKSRAVLGWLLPPSYGSSWRFSADSSLSSLTLIWNVTSPVFAVWPILAHMGCHPSLLSQMSCCPPLAHPSGPPPRPRCPSRPSCNCLIHIACAAPSPLRCLPIVPSLSPTLSSCYCLSMMIATTRPITVCWTSRLFIISPAYQLPYRHHKSSLL